MPQLPKIGLGQTPRLAQLDPSAPVREAQQVTGLVNQITSGIDDVVQTLQTQKLQQQQREAGLQMNRAMVRFEEQFGGRDSYSADEIPQGVQVRRTEKVTGSDGQVMEVPRQEIPAYEVAPEVYRRFASNFAESAASGIDDDQARKEFLQNAEQQINNSYVSRLQQSRAEQDRFMAKQLNAEIQTAADNGQFGVAIELAREINDPELKQQAISGLQTAQENAYYDGLILEGSNDPTQIPAMEEAITRLRDTDVESNLSNAQRLAKATSLESAVRQANTAAVEEEERAKQLAVSMAWTEIKSGNPTVDGAYVQDMFDRKLITGSERTSMMLAIQNEQKKRESQVATMVDLDRIAKQGYGIDPKDKDARKAVDARFNQYTQQMQPFDAAKQIMTEFQVIPSPIISMFRSANRADAPNLQEAAQLFIVAQETAPRALADFKEGEVDFVEKVAANMQLGMDLPSAVDTVNRYDALSPTQRSALRQQSTELASANADVLADFVSDQPSYDIPWSPFNVDVPLFMQSEFDALVQKNLPTMGFDVEASRRAAFNTISRRWVMTDINGDYELMKNAPTGPTDQIRTSIRSTFNEDLTRFGEHYGREFSAKDVKIRPDSLTEIQIRRGNKPTYMAYVVVDEDTQMIEHLGRFEWDAKQAAGQRRDKILKDAQKARKSALEQQERIAKGEFGGNL